MHVDECDATRRAGAPRCILSRIDAGELCRHHLQRRRRRRRHHHHHHRNVHNAIVVARSSFVGVGVLVTKARTFAGTR